MEGITQIFYLGNLTSVISSSSENLHDLSNELKQNWEQILNNGICSKFSILGSEEPVISTARETAFDLFSLGGSLSKKSRPCNSSNLPDKILSDKFIKVVIFNF